MAYSENPGNLRVTPGGHLWARCPSAQFVTVAAAKAEDQSITHVPRTHNVSRADLCSALPLLWRMVRHQLRERGTRKVVDHHLTPGGSVQKRPSPTLSRKCSLPTAGSPAQRWGGVWGQSDPTPRTLWRLNVHLSYLGKGEGQRLRAGLSRLSRLDPEMGPEAHTAPAMVFPG